MKPITYKFVMDGSGLLKGVELWQGDQYITILLEAEGLNSSSYCWIEVKKFLDNIRPPHLIGEDNLVERIANLVVDK